jgi:hypothetical protein
MAIMYNSNYDETIPFSDASVQVALATNTNATFVVPGGPTIKYSARFSFTSTSNIFICLNSAALVPPAGTHTTQQYCEFRPETQRYVQGGDVINMITPDASGYVGISLRQLHG